MIPSFIFYRPDGDVKEKSSSCLAKHKHPCTNLLLLRENTFVKLLCIKNFAAQLKFILIFERRLSSYFMFPSSCRAVHLLSGQAIQYCSVGFASASFVKIKITATTIRNSNSNNPYAQQKKSRKKRQRNCNHLDEILQFADKGFREIPQVWAASFGIYTWRLYIYHFIYQDASGRVEKFPTTFSHARHTPQRGGGGT